MKTDIKSLLEFAGVDTTRGKAKTLVEEYLGESIYSDNEEDPSNPEVLVQGVGRYEYNQVVKNVKDKLADLSKTALKAESVDDWKRVQWMIKHAAMGSMVEAIVAAKTELEGRDGQ